MEYGTDDKNIFLEYGGINDSRYLELINNYHEIEDISLERILNQSKSGRLFISNTLELMEKADISELTNRTVYVVIIPIGYNCTKTGYPLCTSFIKVNNNLKYYMTDTVYNIFVSLESKQSTKNNKDNILKAKDIFSEYIEIVGYGWAEIQKYNSNLMENLENDTDVQIIDSKETLLNVEDDFEDSVNLLDICEKIYDRLLFKENWKVNGKNKLEFYLTHLMTKIAQEQKIHRANGYITTKNSRKCCINTGLLDQFNNDIFIIDLTNGERNISKKKLIILDGKIQLMEHGFSKEQLIQMPKPVKFYEKKSDLIFDGTIDEFDIDNNSKLKHIIIERTHRLPKEYKEYSPDVLCGLIRNSIIAAVKMSERDYKYFVPMYNFSSEKIQFLVPIFLDKSMDSRPDVAAVIGYYKGYYCVNTILEMEKAYDNARLISKPDNNWLSSCIDT